VLTVSSLMDGYLGIEGVCLSIPCVVAREGIVRQLRNELPGAEAAALRAGAEQLREVYRALAG
jgi:L-lactate dehydrogenase